MAVLMRRVPSHKTIKTVTWQLPRASLSLGFGTSLIKNSLGIKWTFFFFIWFGCLQEGGRGNNLSSSC